MAHYDKREIKAIRWLASKYEQGEQHIYNQTAHELAIHLDLDAPDLTSHRPFIALWQRLCVLGAIKHSDGGPAMFVGGITSPRVLDLARSIDANETRVGFWRNWSDGKKWGMGIASALIIAAITFFVAYITSGNTGPPPQEIAFSATNEQGPYAIKSTFEGTASVRGGQLHIRIDRAQLTYPTPAQGYDGPRRIVDIRISLVEHQPEGWIPIRRSSLITVQRKILAGDSITLDPFEETISIHGLTTISGNWLVFDINESIPGETEMGSSHVQTKADLFAD